MKCAEVIKFYCAAGHFCHKMATRNSQLRFNRINYINAVKTKRPLPIRKQGTPIFTKSGMSHFASGKAVNHRSLTTAQRDVTGRKCDTWQNHARRRGALSRILCVHISQIYTKWQTTLVRKQFTWPSSPSRLSATLVSEIY